uniref:SFRICE_035473 n=1 Tax=Spodoptera frugiperda TaxID=7108 RepID=A0A2H1WPX1_SPOFR
MSVKVFEAREHCKAAEKLGFDPIIMPNLILKTTLLRWKPDYDSAADEYSQAVTFRKIRDIFGQHNRPSEIAIKNLVAKFEPTGSVQNVPTPTRVRPGRSTENITAVSHSVEEDQKLSISRRSQQLGLSKSTAMRILRKDLALKPYKIQLVQELMLTDHSNRRKFAQNNLLADYELAWVIGYFSHGNAGEAAGRN